MSSALFDLIHNPLYQLTFFVSATVLVMLFLKNKDANRAWYVAGMFYIGFILTNSLLAWFTESNWAYFFISLGSSFLYILIIGILLSALIRLLKLNGSGEAAMIFIYIIYHPILLLLVMGVKWMVRAI